MFRLAWILIPFSAVAVCFSCLGIAQEQNGPKWLIEWSAVEPRLEYLAESMGRFTRMPFDGTVTSFVADDGAELIWNAWGEKTYSIDDFSRNAESLRSLSKRDKSFVLLARFNVATKPFNWNEDRAWQTVLANTKIMAKLAAMGEYQGILLDTEQYGNQLFRMPDDQNDAEARDRFKASIQKHGQQWIQAVEEFLPSPIVLITFGQFASTPGIGDGRPNIDYQLLAPFLDGVLAAASAQTHVVDGWEFSYGYRSVERFEAARQSFVQSQLPSELRDRMKLAFGIWTDYPRPGSLWSQDEAASNYFSPKQLIESLRFARKHGDGIVWLYSHIPNWWTGEHLPDDYRAAVEELHREWKSEIQKQKTAN